MTLRLFLILSFLGTGTAHAGSDLVLKVPREDARAFAQAPTLSPELERVPQAMHDAAQSYIRRVSEAERAFRRPVNQPFSYRFDSAAFAESDQFARVAFVPSDTGMIIRVELNRAYLGDKAAMTEVQAFLSTITLNDSPKIRPYEWMKTVADAGRGDITAQLRLALMKRTTLSEPNKWLPPSFAIDANGPTAGQLARRARETSNEIAALQASLRQKSARTFKITNTEFVNRVNEAVARNDRAGVAGLLEQTVPWDSLPPSERTIWKEWIEAVRAPDHQNRALVFRGAPTAEFMIKNDQAYAMTAREFSEKGGKRTPLTKFTQDLFDLMRAHSIGATEASPFISVSTTPSTTTNFLADEGGRFERGKANITAWAVDRRRLVPAFGTGWQENELLVPLMLFPDEFVEIDYVDSKSSDAGDRIHQWAIQKKLRGVTENRIHGTRVSISDTTDFLGRNLLDPPMPLQKVRADLSVANKAAANEAQLLIRKLRELPGAPSAQKSETISLLVRNFKVLLESPSLPPEFVQDFVEVFGRNAAVLRSDPDVARAFESAYPKSVRSGSLIPLVAGYYPDVFASWQSIEEGTTRYFWDSVIGGTFNPSHVNYQPIRAADQQRILRSFLTYVKTIPKEQSNSVLAVLNQIPPGPMKQRIADEVARVADPQALASWAPSLLRRDPETFSERGSAEVLKKVPSLRASCAELFGKL